MYIYTTKSDNKLLEALLTSMLEPMTDVCVPEPERVHGG